MKRFLRFLAAGGAALALAVPRPALAAPLLTDATGDAGPDALPCNYVTLVTGGVCPVLSAHNEPAIDIVSGDFDVAGGTLTLTMELDDLDHVGTGPLSPGTDDHAYYHFTFRTTDASYVLTTHRDFGHTTTSTNMSVGAVNSGVGTPGAIPASVTYDGTASTVTATVLVSDVNSALASICSSCSSVGTGTTFTEIRVGTQVFEMVGTTGFGTLTTYNDRTETGGTYTVP